MQCPTGKLGYPTAAAASRVKAEQDKRHGKQKSGAWHRGPSVVYRCPVCCGWHLGHSTQPVKNRKPRLLPDLDWSAA